MYFQETWNDRFLSEAYVQVRGGDFNALVQVQYVGTLLWYWFGTGTVRQYVDTVCGYVLLVRVRYVGTCCSVRVRYPRKYVPYPRAVPMYPRTVPRLRPQCGIVALIVVRYMAYGYGTWVWCVGMVRVPNARPQNTYPYHSFIRTWLKDSEIPDRA